MAAKSVINVKILGDNKGLKASLDDSSNKIGNFVKTAGKSVAAIGIALGVAAVKGIAAFADFEKSMNEVFTLLPGISAEAMDDMSGQVKDFSKKFGVLPEETIPALYQALSAGVPEGNVFDFLEVAQKAAKGGVTDLTTAVDGISSVVNAYGAEIISAAEASDLMFTTVRLGKTTFEEISASISNITPISSALGVGFDEVSAALAVLTSKGVPTAGATTQIKGALAELGKEGTIADKAFRKMTGGGFQDFIDQGGTMGGAFQLIADGAEASDKSVLDMFGSVEAGQAVLALTANGGEAFTDVMGEMAKSAGATQTAYETMQRGLSVLFDKIKANFAVIMINIGEKMAPIIQHVFDAINVAMVKLGPTVKFLTKWMSVNLPMAIQELRAQFLRFFTPVQKAAAVIIKFFVDNWPKAQAAISKVFDWIRDNKDSVIAALAVVGAAIFLFLVVPLLKAAASAVIAAAPFILFVLAIAAIAGALVWAYQNIEPFRNAVDAVVRFLRDVVWPIIKDVAAGIVQAFKDVVAWFQEKWPAIKQIVADVFNWIVDNVVPVIITVVEAIIEAFRTTVAWFQENWPAIKQIVADAFNWINENVTPVIVAFIEALIAFFEFGLTAVVVVITIFVAAAILLWKTFGESLISFAEDAWKGIKKLVEAALKIITGILNVFTSIFTGDWSKFWDGIKLILSGAWDGIKAIVGLAIDAIKLVIKIALDLIQLVWETVWGAVSAFADDVWEGIKGYVSAGIDAVVGFVASLPGRITSAVTGAFDGLTSAFATAINWIIDKWNGISFTLPTFSFDVPLDGRGPYTFGGQTFSTPNLPRLHTGGVVPRLHTGGVVPGLPGTDQLTMLQAGERVTSAAGAKSGSEPDWTLIARMMAKEYAHTLQQERRAA